MAKAEASVEELVQASGNQECASIGRELKFDL
jgi:hypothetical protein